MKNSGLRQFYNSATGTELWVGKSYGGTEETARQYLVYDNAQVYPHFVVTLKLHTEKLQRLPFKTAVTIKYKGDTHDWLGGVQSSSVLVLGLHNNNPTDARDGTSRYAMVDWRRGGGGGASTHGDDDDDPDRTFKWQVHKVREQDDGKHVVHIVSTNNKNEATPASYLSAHCWYQGDKRSQHSCYVIGHQQEAHTKGREWLLVPAVGGGFVLEILEVANGGPGAVLCGFPWFGVAGGQPNPCCPRLDFRDESSSYVYVHEKGPWIPDHSKWVFELA
eukprot:TRINITY_DN50172_c0_g1_i1.p1 TRINITY_DN50172_c0_g1~~TRINITY_DN50172_c0_g1_i1.p1  ORF type:complete len:301 (+),score=41.83 TRINITY_DN50172_c0_g1_i1:77-904(+)